MNPVDSGNVNIASFKTESSAAAAQAAEMSAISTITATTAPAAPAVSATNDTILASSTESASSVSPELQAVKNADIVYSQSIKNDPWASMSKVVDALVGVVTALVSLVTNVMNNFRSMIPQAATPAPPSGSTGATSGRSNTTSPVNQPRSALEVTRSDAGMLAVRTLDGFTVRAEGRDEAWSITGPDGKTTRIWGDPHVTESDGDKWDFVNRATFMFGKNKATVEVVPAGNGMTLSARLTIYSDYERVTIDGIHKNQPTIISASTDGLQHDAALADGEIYKRVVTANGEAWISKATGKVVPVKR
jgi:hypothetical protein